MAREIAILLTAAGRALTLSFKQAADANLIGILQSGERFIATDSIGGRGSKVSNAGSASVQQSRPVQLEFHAETGQIKEQSNGCETLMVPRQRQRAWLTCMGRLTQSSLSKTIGW